VGSFHCARMRSPMVRIAARYAIFPFGAYSGHVDAGTVRPSRRAFGPPQGERSNKEPFGLMRPQSGRLEARTAPSIDLIPSDQDMP